MQFKKVVLASFLALSLVACGDNDDKSKPDDDSKTKEPPKTQECIDAGDKCVLEDGKWVIKKDEEEEPAPTVDSEFDYSNIGVVDKLKAIRKGFGFYHKGVKSPLDVKNYPETQPTLSPIVNWSSQLKYDEDLYNYVAIMPHSEKKDDDGNIEYSKTKYIFDKIGLKNQEENKNVDMFGNTGPATSAEGIGRTSLKLAERDPTSGDVTTAASYLWARVPAVVNTFIYKTGYGSYERVYKDKKDKIWYHEERSEDDIGSGKQNVRVYGKNAFLGNAAGKLADNIHQNFIKVDGKNPKAIPADDTPSEDSYKLVNRSGYFYDHANFVYYDPDLSRETKTYSRKKTDGSYVLEKAKDLYDGRHFTFPTDLQLGELKYVQFGRLTGNGISKNAPTLEGYDPGIKEYPYSDKGNVLIGHDKAEDWYFARGIKPTSLASLDNIKNTFDKDDNFLIYDGMALMFGLDYDPIKVKQQGQQEDKSDKSTNSVLPSSDGKWKIENTILDGKQNLVRIKWTPKTGHINGAVFGVWTTASYYQSTGKRDAVQKAGQIVTMDVDHYDVVPNFDVAGVNLPTGATDANNVIDNALRIGVKQRNLVTLKGKVVDGTNTFRGLATRCKDGDKGIFYGGFFGPQGHEIGGMINSQTGDMSDPKLTDPGNKWGGAFGAQFRPDAGIEYLDFPDDPDFNYDTSNEVY